MPLKQPKKRKDDAKTDTEGTGESQSDVPRLPAGEFRPKQSLGQNFISDKNIMNRLCSAFDRDEGGHADGRQVIEVGAGIGSLTHILYKKYRKMTAIEIDARAISQLSRNIPDLDVIHDDVLQVDYEAISKAKETKLWVIGNLPFYITSQILFCLVDYKRVIDTAVVTAQWEVAQRMVAKPCEFEYSILSVVLQLYCRPKILFRIPNHAFYPVPKVDSGVVRLDFKGTTNPPCAPLVLKRILRDAFNQRRKMLKTSLREFLDQLEIPRLPPDLEDMRPQQMAPQGFVALARWAQRKGTFKGDGARYGVHDNKRMHAPLGAADLDPNPLRVWRQERHGES
ncbi:dimethyladenosine transferase, putative [Babesia bigemina]|uniref:rRNA adenine N(6)-methyltransferase n=1 Tax=Babesia bigemina TaxID=5866 RepID=A0A061DC62_BABBI|nr:dimethyladenosine transferase, putative [Babesia bigemina]CDR96534.1 dimethyladenosine transferase, putative [Babesia bigemina]|eukprot:XP_012768720.1 dimethyladenosine transferase, putative [Babesia bigemina]